METNEVKLHSTYSPDVKYGQVFKGIWRFYDVSTSNFIGPYYQTKELLLVDMKDYLKTYWGYIGG